VERVIGTIRRECLDHVIVLNEASLYRHVKSFLAYYHESRTRLSLAKDTPEPRPVHPPAIGAVAAIPQIGGLHHRIRTSRRLNAAVLAAIPIQERAPILAARQDKTFLCSPIAASIFRASPFFLA
jgi:hypothetical protein